MSFPHDDQYWVEPAKFVKKHIKRKERLLAPAEFNELFSNTYPDASTFSEVASKFQWALIHKGKVEELDYVLLKHLDENFIPVFANEVFVVFSSRKELPPVDSIHLETFMDSLKSIYQRSYTAISNTISNKKTFIDTRESDSRTELEMACRSKCQTVYIGNGTLLCRVLGKYIFYADAEDVGITPHLCLDGYWESWITVAMIRLLKPGWHCVDIGANHGYYSILMADAVGSSGRLLAAEPNPQLVKLLERTVEVNGFGGHATVLQKAIFDVDDKIVKLVIPPGQGRNASVCFDAPAADNVVEVETVTLDKLTRDWPRVDLIKVDAEGAEEAIWRGMRNTVRNNRDISIVMEFNCLRYSNPRGFLQDIQTEGFSLRYIDYDAEIKSLTVDQCLTERPSEDWMLFLKRG
jgi:FkbM family methyltransferase